MTDRKIQVLYVDDEENNLFSFKAAFRLKYKIFTAIGGQQAIEILGENPHIEVIITDQRMPNMTGVEFLESILHQYPDPIRILLTGYADMGAVIDAVNKGKIYHYLSKPWNEEELDMVIMKAHQIYTEREEERKQNELLLHSNNQLEFVLRQKLIS
jgi:response regulator RpfG family c-di-GMP phosphodiesterase